MAMRIIECEQGTPEWFNARKGIPTASAFSDILAKGEGKTRASYMRKLAAEIITGEPGEDYSSFAMQRGKEMELQAREIYAFSSDDEVKQVGFVVNGCAGCSPDSIVGDKGGLEIKTMRPDLLIDLYDKDAVPNAHIPQVQGNMMVTGREWWDVMIYWPKMPPFIKRVPRDRAYISTLATEVTRFNDELLAMVERIKKRF